MSNWVVYVVEVNWWPNTRFSWEIKSSSQAAFNFSNAFDYTRRDSAIRGARRMAKALGIEVEIKR